MEYSVGIADDSEEFEEIWGEYTDIMGLLEDSLPEDSRENLYAVIEDFEELVDIASDHSFEE